ncbi:hypothetical protein PROFUN_08966 [Planoprotostelium fungivorum]|uniref:HAM1-like N-terminal domain-containing protein n=1 Tax=Planoprotostelium fungivorum TaxID=1890364 RepID=A0A2P6N6R4_9EUKA|nr:hypothetical protein PROFUN_10545 [Planoprotostelium fungivorum]PRP83768.1 hypothetical protein PROFUN_08966 [Planoprotostelium fungivorum]
MSSQESKVTVELGKGSGGLETARNIASGTIPSNAVMLDTLSSAQQSVSQSGSNLDSHGQTLAKDTERVLEATKNLLVEKNSDQKLQEVLLSSRNAAKTGADTQIRPRSQAKMVGNDLANVARELATLLAQSREMRGLLLDQIQTFQKLFWQRMNNDQSAPVSSGYTGGHQVSSALGGGQYYSYDTGFTREPVAAYNVYNNGAVSTARQGEGLLNPTTMMSAPSTAPSVAAGAVDPNFKTITLTAEEKRELINSWRQLITRFGAKPNYGNAMNNIFTMFDHMSDLKEAAVNDPQLQKAGDHSSDAMSGVRELVERFMGGRTLDRLTQLVREYYRFATEHPEVRQFGQDWSAFTSETMINPQLLNEQRYVDRMDQLVDRTVYWMNVPYFRNQSRAIADEVRDIFNAVRDDSSLTEVQDSFTQLFRDLAQDQSGNVSIHQLTNSLPHLKNLLAPILIEQFNYIPINRVYGTTPKYDFELSNIVLSASDLVPDRFFLDVHTKAKVGLSSEAPDQMVTRLKLKLTNITATMKNVNFYYLRKKLPKIEDEGVVDVAVLAPGASIKIVWELSTSNKRPLTVNFRKATCDIGNLNVHVVRAKHSILDKIATKLFAGQMRSRIESAVADGLSNVGNSLSDRMNRAVRHKPQPKTDAHVGVEGNSATLSNTKDTTPAAVGRV